MGMTEYEVREYLRSIKILADKRDRKREEIATLQSIATNCVAPMDKEPIQSSGSGDKMAKIVGHIVDLTREVNDIDDTINERTDFLMLMSDKFTDKRFKKYMFSRYIDRNGFYDTVMMMDLSDSTARRIDRKMVFELTDIINHNI